MPISSPPAAITAIAGGDYRQKSWLKIEVTPREKASKGLPPAQTLS
jgi:hypothetical protein